MGVVIEMCTKCPRGGHSNHGDWCMCVPLIQGGPPGGCAVALVKNAAI